MKSLKSPRARFLACWLAAWAAAVPAARADWLVTRAGDRIETDGGWEVRGRMVVFTRPDGVLSSLRLSEIDLDASAAATAEAAAAEVAPAGVTEDAPSRTARRPVRRVITTEDVGEGTPGARGPDLLIERLRQAHAYQDVGLAMGLVNLEGVPDGIRNYIESRFEWMMGQRIRDVRFVASEAGAEVLRQLQDDVLYEPNVDVVGKIEIDFLPDPDQGEVTLTFQVGTRLGSFYLAAPRAVGE